MHWQKANVLGPERHPRPDWLERNADWLVSFCKNYCPGMKLNLQGDVYT